MYLPIPAYFCALEVENVRCFGERQRLDLMAGDEPAKWTVLLGDNGVGKTTLLQCLYAMAPEVDVQDEERFTMPRGLSRARVPGVRSGERWGKIRADVRFNLEPTSEAWERREGDIELVDEFVDGGMGFFGDSSAAPVLCCGYGATRRLGAAGLENRDALDSGDSLFEADVPLINAVEWLLQADYAARSGGSARAQHRRDAVKNALVELLPDVSAIREAGLDEDPPRPRVEVQTPYGWVGLRDLSLGYQTMIAWIVDLASRMFEAYPDRERPLGEAAIVLVDELDLHLHPQWQRRITGYLDELFPKVQFIVTAHSPLVVQGAGVTNVAVLRRQDDQVEILNDPEEVRGWRVDQILTSDLFGLDSARPKDVEALIERQQQLVLLDEPSDDERRELRELDEKLAKLAPGETARDREAWSVVHDFASKLEDSAGGEP